MRRVLITGMSGTGKSSVIQNLTAHGYKAIDTDWDPEWEQLNGTTCEGIAETDWVWREDRIMSLLAVEDAEKLFLGACVPNQGKFYGRFDHIVLLSASEPVTRERLASRTNSSYGKSGDEITDVLCFKATVEPMLSEGRIPGDRQHDHPCLGSDSEGPGAGGS